MVATVGNVAVILHQLKIVFRNQGNSSPVANTNRILVLNLAVADLLVGVRSCHIFHIHMYNNR